MKNCVYSYVKRIFAIEAGDLLDSVKLSCDKRSCL